MTRKRATLELVVASFVWGFGFIAIRWSLTGMGPLWINAIRFLSASAIILPFALSKPRLRKAMRLDQALLSFPAGALVGSCLILQTAGLRYTTATNSSFITVLYVLFVPVIEWIIFRRSIRPVHAVFVVLALAGTALICGIDVRNLGTWNKGDLLTLACSLCASAHIVWVSHITNRIKSFMVFNFFQSLWAGLIPMALAFELEPWANWSISPLVAAGLLYVIFGSTLFAFLIQLRAQRVLSATTASMVFLLESPVASVFAFFLLGERLSGPQWIGAGLIMAATFLALKFPSDGTIPANS